ncbi:MAG: GDSL-type esterase/lipase family protein [Bryobacterales bacterium]
MESTGAAGTSSGIRRSRWIQIAIVLASSAVALLLAEWVVRLTGLVRQWHPAAQTAILQYYEDPNGPAYLIPNWEGYVSGAWTKINADGFRDVSHAPVAQPGVLRLAVVGDSYTMGDGVALKDTYIKQLQAMLSPRFQIEVLNCGVTSTNTMNQLAALPRILARYSPAVVVTAFNVNDFEVYTETRFERMSRDGGRFTVHDGGTVTMERHTGVFRGVKEQFREHSYLYRLASELLPLLRGERQDVVETVRRRFQTGEYARSVEALIKMRDLVEASHARFLVALIPGLLDTPASVTNMKDYPYLEEHRSICEKLSSRGVGCVDLAGAFGDRDPNALIVHRTNRHYNTEGHRLVATALGNYLEAHSAELLNSSSTADGLQPTHPD